MELRGLFDFARYIDQIRLRDVDYGEANTLDENADVVRIMSIHKSKGLEFPVCIVAGTAKRHSFKTNDVRGSFLCDNDWGIGMDLWDDAARTGTHTPRREAIAEKILRESLGEELRVLYVAMTRAKEKLILTGYLDDAPAKFEKWDRKLPVSMREGEKLPIPLLTESENYLELIRAAVCANRDRDSIETRVIRCGDLVLGEMEAQSGLGLRREELERAGETGGAPLPDPEFGRKLREIYSRRYAHEDLRGLYTKTSVSELKASAVEEEGEGAYPLFPERLPSPVIASFAVPAGTAAQSGTAVPGDGEEISKSGAAGTETGESLPAGSFMGTAFGTAFHKILELIDYERFPDPAAVSETELRDWLNDCADAGKIPRSYAEEFPLHGILSFLKSGLAGRMAMACGKGELFREQSFVLGIEADMVDPDFPHGETVLVQGIIDACFLEDGEWVLADYKTDRVRDPEELVRRYRVQLDLYERALSQITGRTVREKLIYSAALSRVIAL